MTRRVTATAVVPLGFAVAVAVLLWAGGDALAPPPLSVDGLVRWADERDVVTASVALARVVALLVAAWLAVATAVAGVARAVGVERVAAAAEHALPGPVRRALTGMAGAGVVSVIAFGGPADRGTDGPPVAVEPMVLVPADGEGTATMSVLADEPATEHLAPEPRSTDGEWIVEPGESFWSIAESVVSERVGRPATDVEVDPYWRALVAANRHRLVTPDPDLVHPGQVFVLPPVSG